MPNHYKNLLTKKRPSWLIFVIVGVLAIIILGFIIVNLDHRLLTLIRPPEVEIGTAYGPEYNIAPPPTEERISIAAEVGEKVALEPELQILLELVNDYRTTHNAPSLLVSPTLTSAAQWMSEDMATNDYFSHTDSLGRDPFERMTDFGYDYNTWKGENLAAGCDTPECIFQLWQDSPGHNANLLNSHFIVAGLGKAYNPNSHYGWYWGINFGGHYDVQTISIDQFIVDGPAPLIISDTQGVYIWVMATLRNLTDSDRVVTTVLSTSSLPSGCDKLQQLVLPGEETFQIESNKERWVLYRERYECHNSSPGVYPLDITLRAMVDGSLDQLVQSSKSLILQ